MVKKKSSKNNTRRQKKNNSKRKVGGSSNIIKKPPVPVVDYTKLPIANPLPTTRTNNNNLPPTATTYSLVNGIAPVWTDSAVNVFFAMVFGFSAVVLATGSIVISEF
tara:strand:- start:353 stop:673 length:321 start_codon:yes stop_codon:yes gene_type:complete